MLGTQRLIVLALPAVAQLDIDSAFGEIPFNSSLVLGAGEFLENASFNLSRHVHASWERAASLVHDLSRTVLRVKLLLFEELNGDVYIALLVLVRVNRGHGLWRHPFKLGMRMLSRVVPSLEECAGGRGNQVLLFVLLIFPAQSRAPSLLRGREVAHVGGPAAELVFEVLLLLQHLLLLVGHFGRASRYDDFLRYNLLDI